MHNLRNNSLLNLFVSVVLVFFVAPRPAFSQYVTPLLRTHWGQGAPYNALSPMDGDRRALAGCGPIAMAQVVRGMEYPPRSPRDSALYAWNLMPDKLSSASGEAERQAIASLIRDCGATAFTRYGADSSSTQLTQIVYAMKKLYGFSPYMMIVRRDSFAGTDEAQRWRDMLFGELRAGRPVLMRGVKPRGGSGHIFVADGVHDTLVHLNFGWNGESDGWYPVDSMGDFTQKVMMAIHVADSSYLPEAVNVVVERPGMLRSQFPDVVWATVQSLSVEGELNADDVRWLRRLASRQTFNRHVGQLAFLDMSRVRMEYLPDSAFYKAAALTYVRLPAGLKVIGTSAFQFCYSLNQVDIPPTVWKIRGGAFTQCRGLLDIHIPEGVCNVLSSTFTGCENLTSVRLPESIDTLGSSVFRSCTRLESLYIPARANQIGPMLVDRCPNVRVTVDSHNSNYRSVDGRLEGITQRAKQSLGIMPKSVPAGKRKLARINPITKVVSRYKIVNGKKVWMGYVDEHGRLIKNSTVGVQPPKIP